MFIPSRRNLYTRWNGMSVICLICAAILLCGSSAVPTDVPLRKAKERFFPPGVYDEAGKRKHYKDVDEAVATCGLYVHFHSNPWCQDPQQALQRGTIWAVTERHSARESVGGLNT